MRRGLQKIKTQHTHQQKHQKAARAWTEKPIVKTDDATDQGHVWWQVGIPLAVANVIGSLLGTRMAMRHGSGFVRYVFILVVTTLALKTAKDAWF